MGNWYEDEDGNDDEQQGKRSGKDLRSQLEGSLAENSELKKQLGKLQQQVSVTALKDVLQEKGLNPALGKWIVKDEVDPADNAAVDAWLSENGSLFGYTPKAPEEQDAPDERAADFARMQGAQANALPAGNRLQELERRIQASDGSPEEVQAILAEVPKTAS